LFYYKYGGIKLLHILFQYILCKVFYVLFKRRENLEIFNKKALYIYIREMTEVDTPIITKVTKKLKIVYKKLYTEFNETGYIKI